MFVPRRLVCRSERPRTRAPGFDRHAAVVVRHGTSGVASRQAILGLGLRCDEAKTIEPPEATDQLFDAYEHQVRPEKPASLKNPLLVVAFSKTLEKLLVRHDKK